MKTIDTKALNTVSGAWGYGPRGYGFYGGGYGYGGWANPYAQAARYEARAAWANAAASNYWAPFAAAYVASHW